MVVEEGKFNVTLAYTKADGTQETYNAGSFDVEALTTKPELLEYLAGGEMVMELLPGNGTKLPVLYGAMVLSVVQTSLSGGL